MDFISGISTLSLPYPDVSGLSCRFDPTRPPPRHPFIALPAELSHAVPKRQAEFIAGRHLAYLALEKRQAPSYQVAIGPGRAPCWPKGFIGSISHSQNKALCVIARQNTLTLLGIDIEHHQNETTAADIAPVIADQKERALLTHLPLPETIGIPLLLSIKESLFKALYPPIQQFMDFSAARITHIDLQKNTWRAQLFIDKQTAFPLPNTLDGHLQIHSDWLFTSVYYNQ